jgi:hypothetical protein
LDGRSVSQIWKSCFLQIWKKQNKRYFVRQKCVCGTELQDDYDDLLCDAIVHCPVWSGELLFVIL